MSASKLITLVVACLFVSAVVAVGPLHRPQDEKYVSQSFRHPHTEFPNLPLRCGPGPNPSGPGPYKISNAYALGLSSGGYLAAQLNVAYSSVFSGAAIFAAGPYYCAQGSLLTALYSCVYTATPLDLPLLEATAASFAAKGLIDPLKNLKKQQVYLFHGTLDQTVQATVNLALNQMYLDYGANVVYDSTTVTNHAWISPSGQNACNESVTPFINNCNGLDVENKFLTHLFKEAPKKPSKKAKGQIYGVSQNDFSRALFNKNASTFSMDTTGYVYVPDSCTKKNADCTILVNLHGCLQGYSEVGNALIQQSNLNGYADTNDYIVLYPQAIPSVELGNPQGCWDWWGFTTPGNTTLYATKGSPQMEIIIGMMKSLGFDGKNK